MILHVNKTFLIASVLGLSSVLSSCGSSGGGVIGNYFRSCSTYNTSRDGFRLSLGNNLVTNTGENFNIPVEASWYNSDLRRENLNCTPNWTVSDPSVLSIADKKATALKPGIVKVTAVVTGSSTVTDSFWVAVRPLPTEQEPNNGPSFAQPLLVGTSAVGFISTSDDTDYYVAEIPAGKAYQFTLATTPQPKNDDPFTKPTYHGNVLDVNGRDIGDVNRGYTNTTSSTLRVYLKVSGYSAASSTTLPYSLTLELR